MRFAVGCVPTVDGWVTAAEPVTTAPLDVAFRQGWAAAVGLVGWPDVAVGEAWRLPRVRALSDVL
jgi:hypothetical protein